MNDMEPSDSAQNPNTNREDLRQQYEGLRKLFVVALIAMLILSGALTIFLFRQWVFLRKDLESLRPQIAAIKKTEEPQIQNFVNLMIGYGRTDPNFKPILAKYKLAPDTAPQVAPTGVPTAPANK
jgi:hypothetical protein